MSKPITIFFHANSPKEYPFTEQNYRDSYELLSKFADNRKIDLRYVFGLHQYKNSTFHSYWKFKNGELEKTSIAFKAGMIYLKTRTSTFDNEKRVNDQFLERVCQDKLLTTQTYPGLFKKTLLLTPATYNLNELTTNTVVIKPRYGSSAKNIHIINKNNFKRENFLNDEYIAQEIIESKNGIPGLTSQRHELRLFVFNDQIKEAYLRLPAVGSHLANISAGAKEQQIDLKDLPKTAIELKDKIDTKFNNISPRLYTIDIMYENNQPWVVELNDQPGMPDISVQPLTNNYLHSLLDLLTEKA